jgi:rubredoxin
MMRCDLCGHIFDETTVEQRRCGACAGGCHGIHCPKCGYKNLVTKDLFKQVKSLFSKRSTSDDTTK